MTILSATLPGLEMEQVPPLEHLEALARERIGAHQAVHEQEARAREEAARRIDARLEQLNELRSEVLTDRARLVSMEAFNAKIEAVNVRIDALSDQITEWRGREKGLSLSASLVVGAVGLVATLVAVYFALAT